MADLITQLQDAINELAENMCNAIGIIQQQVDGPSKLKQKYCELLDIQPDSALATDIYQNFKSSGTLSADIALENYNHNASNKNIKSPNEKEKLSENQDSDYPSLFSKLIAKNVKDISILISHLPSELPNDINESNKIFHVLQTQNEEAAQELRLALSEAQTLSNTIHNSLSSNEN